jgi:molybdopterin synthase sulfur carrier subunit
MIENFDLDQTESLGCKVDEAVDARAVAHQCHFFPSTPVVSEGARGRPGPRVRLPRRTISTPGSRRRIGEKCRPGAQTCKVDYSCSSLWSLDQLTQSVRTAIFTLTTTVQEAGTFLSLGSDMTITIFIPGLLRQYCDGAPELTMPAASVRDALEQLEQRYPSLYRCVCDETGAVRRHMNIFVNSRNTRDYDCDGLDTMLAAGDLVTILPAVSGG